MVALSFPTVTTRNTSFPFGVNLFSERAQQNTIDEETTRIEWAKKGDYESFNELVLKYQDAVYQQAYWILGDAMAAEDAAQETFIRAYTNLNSFRGGPFRPWLLRIATNYCLDMLRKQKRQPSIPLEMFDENNEEIESSAWLKDEGPSIEELMERSEVGDLIERTILSLSPDYRSALNLVDIQGLDYQQACQILGISLGTFKTRLYRARLQFQKNYQKYSGSMQLTGARLN